MENIVNYIVKWAAITWALDFLYVILIVAVIGGVVVWVVKRCKNGKKH